MSRIQTAIEGRSRAGGRAFVPFLTAGYPDRSICVRVAAALAALGSTALEIGIPFSDPVADGPVIQRASAAALKSGVTPGAALELVADICRQTTVPVVIMTYVNPIMQFRGRRGETFADAAQAAGAAGMLITDLPPDQPHECWEQVQAAGLDPILLVTPTTPRDRLATIGTRARGFVYCVGRLGVTGAGPASHGRLVELVAAVRAAIPLPVLIGFGISTAAEARAAAGLADGIVVGSALLECMEKAADPVASVRALASELIQGLSMPSPSRSKAPS
jgi:tryptophan synthase alpha chain